MRQLSLGQRPRIFDQMIGQEQIINTLRKFHKKDRMPTAFLFIGERGSGKTTIAKIMMTAFQCTHQEAWGNPCKRCRLRAKQGEYSTYEINAGEETGKDEIQNLLQKSNFGLLGRGKKRVFFFDEIHAVSKASKTLLLKYIEPDVPDDNIWILGTSKPEELPDNLASRCQVFYLKPFGVDETTELVNRLLRKVKSKLDPDALVEALQDKRITSPRLIVQAVDRYTVDEDPVAAADVAGMTDVRTKELCRCLIKGDWEGIVSIIRESPNANARGLRVAVVGYLRAILLDSPEIDSKSKAIGKAIRQLAYMTYSEDLVQMSALLAELQIVCELLGKYSF